MLRTLTRFLRRAADDAQLALAFDEPPLLSADDLLARLARLGLRGVTRCRLTKNRAVMVSVARGELRVHEDFLAAPLDVLEAIVRFVNAPVHHRAERADARAAILAFPVDRAVRARRRPDHTHADDASQAARLTVAHARLNAVHFGGRLRAVPVRISRRLHARLGHYSVGLPTGEPAEIVISRRHIRRHGWAEAMHTLLHEMVHQWQDETGQPIDHGAMFRVKCREVGITPFARRTVGAGGVRLDVGGEGQRVETKAARGG